MCDEDKGSIAEVKIILRPTDPESIKAFQEVKKKT